MRASTARDNERRQSPYGGGMPGGADRHPAVVSGPWLLPGHDGRLLAYTGADQAVLRWTESRAGGRDWLGPDILPAKDVSALTVAQGRNRYAHLIGRRVRGGGHPLAVDLVYAIQYQAGRPMSEWRSLGNPLSPRERSAQTGLPAAAVAAAGTLYVFAPLADGRISLRREDARGSWEPWRDLGTTGALGTPVAVAASTGHVGLVAPAATGVLTWYQQKPGGALERGHDLGVVPLPGSLTGLETSPGRITYYLTDVRNGGIVAVRPGEWPVPVGGNPGDGRHAALCATIDGHLCTVLAHRDAEGRAVLGLCPTEGERYGVWWTDAGTACLGDPVLAHDAHGRIVVLVVTGDGTLALARQGDGPGLTLGDWTRI